ncbi:MAG TPA: hypothetical protein VKZ49_13835 [Polyangiaceae bacterium]|nr:hypothetical protein [Polyangiaceae bacterium]
MAVDERYSRQCRLPEIGPAGQARLASAELCVGGREEALMEALYLHRAGVERLRIEPERPAAAFAHASAFRFEATRRAGAAAWRALGQLRRALGVEEA